MAYVATGAVIRQLGTLFEGGSVVGLSDRQLLERYSAGRCDPSGEAAFAALVGRYGPMVLGVCRQLLGDVQHAEDAFQAVFLILARKAPSIRNPDLLGNWLYGVAIRTARCARHRIARGRGLEGGIAMEELCAGWCAPADRSAIAREQAEILHDEVGRLPRAFRRPVVLCYFEGLTLDEAARRLRCPAGTLHSRLARAREKLRIRLSRRGVTLPAILLPAVSSPRLATTSIPPLLCDSTTRTAIRFAARHAVAGGALSVSATTLAREVLRTMLLHKLGLTSMTLLFLAIAVMGAGGLMRPIGSEDEPRQPAATQAAIAPSGDAYTPHQVPGRMLVVGRVLDPRGNPVPNASVMVHAAPKTEGRTGTAAPTPIGQAVCDGSGRFRLDAARISSSSHHRIGASAFAPGYGTGWAGLDVDADQPAADITLRHEKVIEGRLFDIQGQPAGGVRVSVEGMGHPRRDPDALPSEIEGPHFWGGTDAKSPAAWPRPAITDAEGRFTIRGLGRELRVLLIADDPRFARQRIVIDTDGTAALQQVTAAMEPAKVITGRVTYADTGKPVPHAAIEIIAYRGGPGYSSDFETDAEGNFRANPFSTDRYALIVFAPPGQPYLNATTGYFEWTKGMLEHRVDLALRRGTVIRGKVTEEGSGRPVAGAALRYSGRRPAVADDSGPWSGSTQTGPDGSYLLPVLPDPGTLVVLGPSEDYVLQEMGQRVIREGRPGGERMYAHAFIPCELKRDTETREINVAIRRGTTVKARVLGPDGQPVKDAWAISRVLLLPQPWPWRRFWGDFHGDVLNGRFELHGLAPDAEVPVHFFDPKHQLGATAIFSVKAAADGPITVRLEPCGQAMARLVDPKGNPLAGYRDAKLISMIVTPGRDRLDTTPGVQDQLSADGDYLSTIDPDHHADLISNVQGRVTFPSLIPGATYRINDMTTVNDPGGRKTRRLFVAGAGAAIELGDVVIEKPEP
ncbi:MAG: sigma-70 family RNA polymerase sigma factor [Isosphaeraceae bacterium]